MLPNTGPARSGTLVFQGYDSSGAPRLCSKTIQQEAGSPPPVLRVNPTTLTFGYSPTRQTLNIWNNGGGILGYSVGANRSWIGVSPGSGTCGAGQTNFITVSIDVSALLVGTHTGTVTVASTAGTTNIAVTVHIADNDGDLIPDGWETQYFGSPANCNPFLDSDGDGQNNRQEWIGGSNPTNKLSAFTISSVALGPGGSNVVIRWPTLPGRVYDVLWSTNASGPFLPLGGNLPHTQTNYSDTAVPPSGFYRVNARIE